MLRTRKTSDEADAISANVLADDVAESQHVGMDKFFSKLLPSFKNEGSVS